MKRIRDVAELEDALKKLRPGWSSGDREFAIESLAFLGQRLFAIEDAIQQLVGDQKIRAAYKASRKPSEWQRFFSDGMKSGKSAAQVGAEWRERKAKAGR